MNRHESLEAASWLKVLHTRFSEELADTLDTLRTKAQRARLVKDMDRIAKLNADLLKDARKPTKTKTEPDIQVGNCPCGQPIMIGKRYAVNVKGPTTINRKCPGTRYEPCGRVNAVIVSASCEVQRATWDVLDCRCGATIYLRSDYSGGPRFTGYDIKGKSKLDLWTDRGENQKNRTVKIECSQCSCKYSLVIRFVKGEGDAVTRTIADTSTVQRCRSCKAKESKTEATA